MKHLFALMLCCLMTVCCTQHQPLAPPRPKDVTSVRVYKDFTHTLHVDTDFSDIAKLQIVEAAEKWRTASGGHIDISAVADLDFESTESVLKHKTEHHSVLIGVTSDLPVVARIDAELGRPGVVPMAVTVKNKDGSIAVYVIVDRVKFDSFKSVVTHELGHVAGMPDLPTTGSIMSGASFADEPPILQFTRDDLALCRASKYCE